MKTSAVIIATTIYCVTITVLQQLIAPQLRKESIASNENYAELKVILHKKSKFLYTIVCCLVVTRYTKHNKEFEVTQNGVA